VVHIRSNDPYATETLCGVDLRRAGYVLGEHSATDLPLPGPTATSPDLRCPDCWQVWRARRDDALADPISGGGVTNADLAELDEEPPCARPTST
jgi:hypothetical protein